MQFLDSEERNEFDTIENKRNLNKMIFHYLNTVGPQIPSDGTTLDWQHAIQIGKEFFTENILDYRWREAGNK